MKWLRKHSLDLLVLSVYCVLTLAMTWPLIAQMSTHLAGDDVDMWINPWATWWTRKVLREGLDLYYTDYLFHPQGVSLVFHSFSHTNTALALVLEPLIGEIAAHNTTTLLTYALSGFAMYLLILDLFRNRAAAFVAGVVFAFSPYHMDQALHPVIASVQWIPLFFLFFIRLLEGHRVRDAVVAVVFLLLTTLTSWHLFLFTVVAGGIYGMGKAIAAWRSRTRFFTRAFVVFVMLAMVTLLLLMWPVLREWLQDTSTYGAAPVDFKRSQSLDLLAFFMPTCRHPVWGDLTLLTQVRTLAQRRSVFLGFCALVIAVYGLVRWRSTVVPWIVIGAVFWVFSLGPIPRLWEVPLLTLPWGAPLMQVFRASHRFHIMTILAFAVLVGWGAKLAWDTVAERWGQTCTLFGAVLVSGVILFEYLSVPIDTGEIKVSPFVVSMGQDTERYAVADLPLGRRYGRHYMFQQMFHEKPLIEGAVSRTPMEAYAFIRGDILWDRLLENGEVDIELRDVSRHLAYLSKENVRYVIVHRHLLTEDQQERWLDYFTVRPLYEDDLIVVYNSYPKHGRDFELDFELGAGVGLIRAVVTPVEVAQDGSLSIDLRWGSRSAPGRDLQVCLALVNEGDEVLQEVCHEPVEGWPTSEWPTDAVGIGRYEFPVDPRLPGGEYALAARLVEPATGQTVGESAVLEMVTFKALPRVFDIPAFQHTVSETLGGDLTLLGYDLDQETDALNLTLHWRAERRMSQYYKFFIHLLDGDTSTLVAQVDWVPRNWTYPTHWWESGEVVSEDIPVPLAQVPDGQYTLTIGVYSPGGDRLSTEEGLDHIVLDEITVP
jgi:hypothetical protein